MRKTCGDTIQTLARDNPPQTVKTNLDMADSML